MVKTSPFALIITKELNMVHATHDLGLGQIFWGPKKLGNSCVNEEPPAS